jgi:hypothetical protein
LQSLDSLVALDLLFPQSNQRELFDAHLPTTEGDARTYEFELKPQPGMVQPRHFFLVLISFTHAPSSKASANAPSLSSTAGPNGSFVEASATTADNVYQVRVSQAMLLPDSVQILSFDPMGVLTNVLHRYETLKAQRTSKRKGE